jgi:hypothetical protein
MSNNYPPFPPYVSAENNVPPFPTLWPPPIQGLAKAFFTPHMAPTPVATRLPQPDRVSDTVNGFLRIEAAGGALQADAFLFNCNIILHSYANNNQESLAEIIMMQALAKGGNAMGQMITHPSLQRPWFVTYSRVSGLALKQNDPLVAMTRFRGMVTWRIQGQYDPLPNDTDPLQ